MGCFFAVLCICMCVCVGILLLVTTIDRYSVGSGCVDNDTVSY